MHSRYEDMPGLHIGRLPTSRNRLLRSRFGKLTRRRDPWARYRPSTIRLTTRFAVHHRHWDRVYRSARLSLLEHCRALLRLAPNRGDECLNGCEECVVNLRTIV